MLHPLRYHSVDAAVIHADQLEHHAVRQTDRRLSGMGKCTGAHAHLIPTVRVRHFRCFAREHNAAALGIVTGYEDGTFRPYKTISRQEAVAMLDRLYAALGGKTDVVSEKVFADDVKIGDWARDSVYAMRQTGIMQGKENNQFCPTDGYTAEQSIVTIERMYQIIK